MNQQIHGGGFIIARKLFKSEIWLKSPIYLKSWLWILGQANHSDHQKHDRTYKRGEFFTTYEKIISATAYYQNRKHIVPTIKQIRIILNWLQLAKMIIIEPIQVERLTGADLGARTGAYLGIKIIVVNYDTYQNFESYKGRDKGTPKIQQGHNNNNGEENKNDLSLSEDNEDSEKLSQLLLDLILQNNPNFKKPDLTKWAVEIDRMLRLDNRTPEEAERVILWCQKDNFWKSNILSAKKLREKYDQLYMKMQGQQSKGTINGKFSGKEYVGDPMPDWAKSN